MEENEEHNKAGKKDRSTTGLIVFFIIVLVVFTIFIFVKERARVEQYVYDYNGFKVQKVTDAAAPTYRIQIFINKNQDPYYITMRNDPKSLENISLDVENLRDKVLKDELFITMDPNATGLTVIAGTEISKIIGSPFLFNIPSHGALIRDAGNNAPVFTCDDVNETTSVIRLEDGEENKIYTDGDCVVVQGVSEEDIIRGADRLSFTMLGVMK